VKELFEQELKTCRRFLQRVKRNYMNELLSSTEQDLSQGKGRNFFTKTKKYKKFNPTLKAVKDVDGRILMEPGVKVGRWMEYFKELLGLLFCSQK